MSDNEDDQDPRHTEAYWLHLVKLHGESVRFFSNSARSEREAYVARNFLKNLGLEFGREELRPEPQQNHEVDVWFRDARFQVKELMDEDRRRDAEYKELLRQAKEGLAMVRRGEVPPPLSRTSKDREHLPFEVFAAQVADRARSEATKPKAYAPAVRASVDLLIYANRLDSRMVPPEEASDYGRLAAHGWRSVSFLHSYNACVLYASPTAPKFLKDAVGMSLARDPLAWADDQ